MNNFSRSITSNEIAAEIKSLPSGGDGFTTEFYQTFGEDSISVLLNLLHKAERKGHNWILSVKPVLPWCQNQERTLQKEKTPGQFLWWTDTKSANQVLPNHIQEHIKKTMYHEQTGFILKMQGWFNRYKSMNVKYHINKLKARNPQSSRMIPKGHLAVQYAFMIKVLEMLGIIKGYRQQTYSQHYTK